MATQCLSYKRYVVIVASGSGKRMGADVPKQYLLLDDKPILLHTLLAVHNSVKDAEIVLVISEEHKSLWEDIVEKFKVKVPYNMIFGGKERFDSVRNAINYIASKEKDDVLIAIHDGVRPFCSEVFEPCFAMAKQRGNAICAVKSVDSIRQGSEQDNHNLKRDEVFLVQTPQCFDLYTLKKAYLQQYQPVFTDDASLVENLGQRIFICQGDRKNIKITTQEDLLYAQFLTSKNTL